MDLKHIREFFDALVHVLSYSNRLATTPYHVDVIVNPVAGKVARHHILQREIGVVRAFADRLKSLHPNRALRDVLPAISSILHISEKRGYAALIARDIVASVSNAIKERQNPPKRRLVVTVGGDGTHEEVLSVLYDAAPSVLQNIEVFRLPMGTGNDGADAEEVEEACELLYRGDNGSKISAVRVKAVGLDPFYSFNIASLGIDAYVTDLTNRLRGIIPGDAYKIIADVATLFYEPPYRHGPMIINTEADDGSVETISGKVLLFAMGVSGHRVYGGAKPVLPGDENLCVMTKVDLIRKIQLKKLLYQGAHVLQPTTTMRTVRRATIHYNGSIPVQVDGESRWLHPEHFPVDIEVLEPRIHVLTHPRAMGNRRTGSELQTRQTQVL